MIVSRSEKKLINSVYSPSNSDMEENLMPMINIIFLMLIFFMVAGQIRYQSDKDITTPTSSSEEKLNSTDIEILIDSKMNIEYDGEDISLTEVPKLINNFSGEKNLVLRADKKLKASQLDEVLNILRSTKITTLKLISSTS